MYIDFIKNDYSELDQVEASEYVNRDKKHLEKLIQERIRNDIYNIVDRWYDLENIGVIYDNERFLELLKEAESLYSFGYYIGTISLIGIACEEFCKYLISNSNILDAIETQDRRLSILKSNNIISNQIHREFNIIRKLRNSCVHFNNDFKRLDEGELKSNALKAIKFYKSSIQQLTSAADNDSTEIIDKLINTANISFEDFKLRQRNISKIENGLDLQISPKIKYLHFNSNYFIAEIDIDNNLFKEMTLFDLDRNMPLVVDLTIPQANMIQDLKLEVGNVIFATLLSFVSTIGQTEEWHLLNIEDVFVGKYTL